MSSPRFDEIRARLARATPGPWEAYFLFGSRDQPLSINGGTKEIFEAAREFRGDDARFIAAAPDDIAFLLAEVEASKKDAREWHDEARSEGRARQFYQEENALMEAVIEAARQTVKASERLHDTSGGIHRIGLALERYDAHRAGESYPDSVNPPKLDRSETKPCPDCNRALVWAEGRWRCEDCRTYWSPSTISVGPL